MPKTCRCNLGINDEALLGASVGSKASMPGWGSSQSFCSAPVVFHLELAPNILRLSGWGLNPQKESFYTFYHHKSWLVWQYSSLHKVILAAVAEKDQATFNFS